MKILEWLFNLLKIKRIRFPLIALAFTMAFFDHFGVTIEGNQIKFWSEAGQDFLINSFVFYTTVVIGTYFFLRSSLFLSFDQITIVFASPLIVVGGLGILLKLLPDSSMIDHINSLWFVGLFVWGLYEIEDYLWLRGGSLINP